MVNMNVTQTICPLKWVISFAFAVASPLIIFIALIHHFTNINIRVFITYFFIRTTESTCIIIIIFFN